MSQIAPIVLVTAGITFTPVAHSGNLVTYKDLSEPVPSLRKTLTVSLTEPSKTSQLYKVRFRIMIPVEKMSTDAVPVGLGVVDYINSSDHTFIHDGRSTTASRDAVFSIVTDFVNTAAVYSDLASDLIPLY